MPDPTCSHFDMYGIPTPAGDWSYALDDFGIVYGPGWWPLHRIRDRRTDPYSDCRSHPRTVRVSPDTAYQSWRNEYVLLGPRIATTDPALILARMHLYVRPQGMGAIIVNTTAELDLRARSYTVNADCPAELAEQADTKTARLLAFALTHRAARRAGQTTPTTAHDTYTARNDNS